VEDVGTLVAEMESRGITFHADSVGVRFPCEDADSQLPGDPARLSELVLDRADETLDFLGRRTKPTGFGAYAGIFRAAVYRIRTSAEMLPWLRERCPSLYADLTVHMPDSIQVLWERGAPLEEFERAVRRLEETHAAALGLIRACEGEDDVRKR
jgi:hypothetical protein